MIPIIYENANSSSNPSNTFNAVHLILDGGVKSTLEWNSVKEVAKDYINKNYRIFWELDCGLFHQLPHPITNQNQFLSLTLSLDHFRNCIWSEFEAHSIGVCIYKGSADFSRQFPWDDQQRENFSAWLSDHDINDASQMLRLTSLYCRNVATDYLKLLTGHLPDAIPTYVMLDGDNISDLEVLAQLVSPICYFPLHQAIKNVSFYLANTLGWESSTSQQGFIGKNFMENTSPPVVIGVCMPPPHLISSEITEGLSSVLSQLSTHNIAFKMIAEENLVSEWEGLDSIIVCSKGVTPSGLRKLRGFCAAGGQILTIGTLLGLPIERVFDNRLLSKLQPN